MTSDAYSTPKAQTAIEKKQNMLVFTGKPKILKVYDF